MSKIAINMGNTKIDRFLFNKSATLCLTFVLSIIENNDFMKVFIVKRVHFKHFTSQSIVKRKKA